MKNNDKILTDDELKQRVSELMEESKKAGIACTYLASRDDKEKPLMQIAFNGTRVDIEALICTGIVCLAKSADMSVSDIVGDIVSTFVTTDGDK